VTAPSTATVLVFAVTLVLGWVVPLALSYAIGPLARLTRGTRPSGERPERAYLIVKYGVFALAIVAYGALVWWMTSVRGVVAWPSWGAFVYSSLGALSAISDPDRQAWSVVRRARRIRRLRRQTP
jgi:hypothetical protein